MSTQALLPLAPVHAAARRRSSALDFALSPPRRRPLGVQTLTVAGGVHPRRLERDLERMLARAGRTGRGGAVEIGGLTPGEEPWTEGEGRGEGMRPVLELLATFEGLAVTFTTRSPRAAGDLDLLERLDQRHTVSVRVPLPALEVSLAWSLEGPAPLPQARLRSIERLAAAGLAADLVCAPLVLELNDDEELLGALFAAAHRAGARDVVPGLFALRPTARRAFLRWLEEEHPQQARRCRWLYGLRGQPAAAEAERTLARFRRLRLEHGFPRPLPGRG